ncbi:MAG: hypothetical protein PHP01_08860 [Phycisphaerae bacterium]|nr:hypothetical protein [Phycisphaerae bacterium]
MSISLHCECCKKKITAPDNAGGKWGKCPYCSHKCYIPLPASEDEEVKLAPIDENEETQYKQMMRETYHVTETLLQQVDEPPEPGQEANIDEKTLTVRIIKYLAMMARSSFDEAQAAENKIFPYRKQAKRILENMLREGKPEPELADIPEKLLAGFIRNMLAKMG